MEEIVNCRFARRGKCSLNRVDKISVEFCGTCKDQNGKPHPWFG